MRRAAYLDGERIHGDQAEAILGREAVARTEYEASNAAIRTARNLGYPDTFA
jgi:hypothetical protein